MKKIAENMIDQLQNFRPDKPESEAWKRCLRTSLPMSCSGIVWLSQQSNREALLTAESLDLIRQDIDKQQSRCPACKDLFPKQNVFGIPRRIETLPCVKLRKKIVDKITGN